MKIGELELDLLMRHENTIKSVKSKRLSWMEENGIPKKILKWKSERIRLRGKPRKRWCDDVEEDIKLENGNGKSRLEENRL